jgi:hypothetical protein
MAAKRQIRGKTVGKAPRKIVTREPSTGDAATVKLTAGKKAAERMVVDRLVSASTRKPAASGWRRAARPDAIDIRDRMFIPNIALPPAAQFFPFDGLPVKNQGETNACTGFALSLVVEHLLRKYGREADTQISPYMLYSMARRYDEFPGAVADEGSSLRGSLKGWFKHGACRFELFPDLDMPPAAVSVEDDWWYEAVRRPLGAYYRIKPNQITDMHAAINEVGILYASCGCHSGWDVGLTLKPMKQRPTSFEQVWPIPVQEGTAQHDGHAFAIVGYNEKGFLVQNSWGTDWGSYGYGLLTYDDWIKNAMDCWVAQLGVVTQDHETLAKSSTLRVDAKTGKVRLAASERLRNREISPFILNMGDNGALSDSGEFRTRPDDVRAIVDIYLERACSDWGVGDKPVDVCIYVHGGLVGEKDAATIAAQWIPLFYDNHIFPIFLMWESDLWNTLGHLIEDKVKGLPRVTGTGLRATVEKWWNQRLERALARPGTAIWSEMKSNAQGMSFQLNKPDHEQPGAVLLYRYFKQSTGRKLRLHFVGHSCGAIAASYMLERLARERMSFESVTFMAPAIRVDTFEEQVKPLIDAKRINRFQQFLLTERAEEDDPTCGPYRRSLLHLVSESFEGGVRTPILGMEQYFKRIAGSLKNTAVHYAPGAKSAASTHGGFDNDPATMRTVVKFIHGD